VDAFVSLADMEALFAKLRAFFAQGLSVYS
jgi:hypothetical protein